MKKLLLLLVAALFCTSGTVFGWGKVGHDAIAYIAECNLTPKAKANIEKYLGHSIVYDASWMDSYRFTDAYGHTSAWHTANVDADNGYVSRERGDAVHGIEDAVAKLQDYKNQSDSTVDVCLKVLIHLVGDMHCPSHVKYPGVKGFDIWVDGVKYNYHGFWDGYAIENTHKWYYTEWQQQMDRCSKKEKQALAAGTPRDWFADNARNCAVIYVWAKPGQKFETNKEAREFVNRVKPLAEQQVLKAGYRLAALLNELFG